jgi:DNA primase
MTISFPSRSNRRVKLRRSSHVRKCPVCGGEGCGQGDGLTLCFRVQSDKQAASGAWIHRGEASPQLTARDPHLEPLRASIERRDAVYSAMLAVLPLYARHADHLRNERRFSQATIDAIQFRSVPNRDSGDWLAGQLAKNSDLRGIPGFWRRYEQWVMAMAGCAGFFIPIRNLAGQIEALQIRLDHGKPKYLLFSSTDKPEGCNSGTPVHFARVHRDVRSIIVTEGALKAEVIAEQMNAPVIGLVAVGTFPDSFGVQLGRELPNLEQVLIAYDRPEFEASDRARANTAQQLERLKRSIDRAGLKSEALTWEGVKGLDDYLLMGRAA